ncbi:MAG: sulfite exporter TauE/SafE family protein [Candidatus Asgardarchaeia archaeon]
MSYMVGGFDYIWEIFFLTLLVGAFAQLIDGALGMAYGVISNTFLLAIGITPAVASASIHTAEVFTTLASGTSHLKVGNVDRKLFKQLVVPGCIGAIVGAYLLVDMPIWLMKPAVNIYLCTMGIVILFRAFNINLIVKKVNKPFLAGIGGFMDAIGGGGWGPIETSTLIAEGNDPVEAIGSVNLAEFFVTLCETLTFFVLIGFQNFFIVLGLMIGGVIIAPLGAVVCRRAPKKYLMPIIGILIMFLSVRNLIVLNI